MRHVACQNCHLEAIQGEGEAKKDRCFQCHNEPARLSHYTDIDFMHKNHVTDHKIDCTRCHEEIKHAVKTTVEPLQYDCSVCHERKHNIQKQIYKWRPRRPEPPERDVRLIGLRRLPPRPEDFGGDIPSWARRSRPRGRLHRLSWRGLQGVREREKTVKAALADAKPVE